MGLRPKNIMCQHQDTFRVNEASLPRFCKARHCSGCVAGPVPDLAVGAAAIGPALQPAGGARPPDEPRSFGVATVFGNPGMPTVLNRLFHRSDEFHSCGGYATAAAALRAIPDLEVDVLLTELRLPDGCGIHIARHILACRPGVHVVVAGSRRDLFLVPHASAAGITGWLTKPFSFSQCLATLRLVAWQPTKPLPQPPAPSLNSLVRPPATEVWNAALNEREELVLAALARGLLYKEVAARLGFSEAVVRKVTHQIFGKFHAGNRTEAVNAWRASEEHYQCQFAPRGG
jgi:DNA-binding NarL/FixJ family response regulator